MNIILTSNKFVKYSLHECKKIGIFPKICTSDVLLNESSEDFSDIHVHIAESRINFASFEENIRKYSIIRAMSEINFLIEKNIKQVVLHPGSTKKLIKEEQGILNLIECLKIIINESEGKIKLIIENMCGGNKLLQKNEDMINFLSEIRKNNIEQYISLCWDTCHFFGANYDINNFNSNWPFCEYLDEVSTIHLNNSSGKLGAGLDRHGYWCSCKKNSIDLEVARMIYKRFKFKKNIILETSYEINDFQTQIDYITTNSIKECSCNKENILKY